MQPEQQQVTRRLLIALCAVQGVFCAAGLIILLAAYRFATPLAWILGCVAGLLFSCLKVVMLSRTLKKSLDMDSGRASNHIQGAFMARYMLTIVFLVVVFLLRQYVNPLGAVLGLLSAQLAAYVAGFLERRDERKNPPTVRSSDAHGDETVSPDETLPDLTAPSLRDGIAEVVQELKK